MNDDNKKELTPLEKIIERQQVASKKGYEKWKDFLTYTGIAMAIVSAIVYLIVVFILINGFEVDYSKEEIAHVRNKKMGFIFSRFLWQDYSLFSFFTAKTQNS